MDFIGSQTEKNLLTAFAGESQARNRYTYFSGAARKEGLIQISLIFEETANQEKEHAKRFFQFLKGEEVLISATFPAGVIGTTAENLRASATGEHHEWTEMYPEFAQMGQKEGFADVAAAFNSILVAERQHENRYLGFLKNVEEGKVFKKDRKTAWRCLNCGYVHEGTEAPKTCPACLHPRDYFEVLSENW